MLCSAIDRLQIEMNLIKKISIGDAKIISEIHAKCFAENWGENICRDMLTNNQYFGFIVSNCGFILCKRILEEAEIITFCMLPEYRKRGLGKLLINEVIQHANILSYSKIFLEVSKDNTAAINLYKSFGFEKISERKGYYKTQNDPIDADSMALEVTSHKFKVGL